MQTKYRYLKTALCAMIIFAGQSLSAQLTDAEAGTKPSTMVSRMLNSENTPSFDAAIIPDSSDTKFILVVENPLRNKLNVRVYHSFYGELFSKEIREELYRNRFDLSKAEDGFYTVEIACGREKIKKRVEINTVTNVSRKIVVN